MKKCGACSRPKLRIKRRKKRLTKRIIPKRKDVNPNIVKRL